MEPRFWTCHWRFQYWRLEVNHEGEPIRGSGGNLYTSRGVRGGCGHRAYIVSINDGQLYFGGRMCVSRIVSRDEAVRIRGTDQLYPADEWLIDDTPKGGTPLHLRRRLAPDLTRQIMCLMADGDERGLCMVGDNLDPQATRGVRQLTADSAEWLDHILAITDAMPSPRRLLTVTAAMLESPAKA
jgi:hypothetical protein